MPCASQISSSSASPTTSGRKDPRPGLGRQNDNGHRRTKTTAQGDPMRLGAFNWLRRFGFRFAAVCRRGLRPWRLGLFATALVVALTVISVSVNATNSPPVDGLLPKVEIGALRFLEK